MLEKSAQSGRGRQNKFENLRFKCNDFSVKVLEMTGQCQYKAEKVLFVTNI